MAQSDIVGIAVAGDSFSDEYANEAYSYAKSWVELLAQNRGMNFGSEGTYAEPRREGYGFDWARAGAHAGNLSAQGQLAGITSQITAGSVSHVVIALGEADFGPASTAYSAIYNGTWTAAQTNQYVQDVVDQIRQSVDLLSFPGGRIVLANIPDFGATPAAQQAFPDALKRGLVSTAIQAANHQLSAIAEIRRIPFVDLHGLYQEIVGTGSVPKASVSIGGVAFQNKAGVATSNLFTADGLHPQTVLQSLVANTVVETFRQAYDATYAPLSESNILTLAGQSYAGDDTLNMNYGRYVTLPHVKVYVDFGNGSFTDDFATRMTDLATRLGVPAFSASEIATLESTIQSTLSSAFAGFQVQFTDAAPAQGSYHTLKYGQRPAEVLGAIPDALGFSTFDWQNQNTTDVAYVFPADFYSTGTSELPRSELMSVLSKALSFFGVHGLGRTLGLNHQDAFGDPRITTENYANTQGIQLNDFMYANENGPFDVTRFQGNPAFSFSQLSRAKLHFAFNVTPQQIASQVETNATHESAMTAQMIMLTPLPGSSLVGVSAGNLRAATILRTNELDFYGVNLQKGDLLTANVLAASVSNTNATLDPTLQVRDSSGNVLAESDDTFLGKNSFGSTSGSVKDSNDAFVLNYVVPSDGIYYLVVGGKAITGSYDLFVTKSAHNPHPWMNPRNPLDVDDDSYVAPIDILRIINELNQRFMSDSTGKLPVPITAAATPPPFLDVNGDDFVSPLDALLIINHLNRSSGEGETETTSTIQLDANTRVAINAANEVLTLTDKRKALCIPALENILATIADDVQLAKKRKWLQI